MIFEETKIKGIFVIKPEPYKDERGHFLRIFCRNEFEKQNIRFEIKQINRSLNYKKGTIRGLHYQKEPTPEAKIIHVVKGKIFDVAVDLRPKSSTYGKAICEILSQENDKLFYLTKGVAHGFQTLVDDCEVEYLMDEFYSPIHAGGIQWNDPQLKIEWPTKCTYISEKDKNWPCLRTK